MTGNPTSRQIGPEPVENQHFVQRERIRTDVRMLDGTVRELVEVSSIKIGYIAKQESPDQWLGISVAVDDTELPPPCILCVLLTPEAARDVAAQLIDHAERMEAQAQAIATSAMDRITGKGGAA